MESVNLKLKFMDAVKMVIINLWLPCILGIGIAAYNGSIGLDNLAFFLTLLVGLITAATLFAYCIPYLTLTEDGLNFKNWRGRNVLCKWDEDLSIESQKYGSIPVYRFKQEGKRNTYQIPTVLFSYDEGKQFIKNYAPANHQLRNIVS